MLFNSYIFIFEFLPLAVVGFFLAGHYLGRTAAKSWLVLCSFYFYGYWYPQYVLLLLTSILVNFSIGRVLQDWSERAQRNPLHGRMVLIAGIGFNLALLGYYKYFDFFSHTANDVFDTSFSVSAIALPLAISFFTFQQITYLVDSRIGGLKRTRFLEYCLFVTFFPQLIAGPIVHHKEIIPQYARGKTFRFSRPAFAFGLSIFIIGLFKKVVIADGVGAYADPVFEAARDPATNLEFFQAWAGALSYTFQLYFDFSGYSDMAIGLGRICGVKLPVNFNSPYQATSVIEFWRRWHMSLSQFLRDYVYIPLGGNRLGPLRRQVNVLLVMLIGGLWHGAGWTFVFWGGLHGVYLMVNFGWRRALQHLGVAPLITNSLYRQTARGLTFFAVVIAWVFFRAEDFHVAERVLMGMAGAHGAGLAEEQLALFGPAAAVLKAIGVSTQLAPTVSLSAAVWIAALFVVVWGLPNTVSFATRDQGMSGLWSVAADWAWRWKHAWLFAIPIGVLGAIALASISSTTKFLYFQF